MKVFIRQELCVENPINLRKLAPLKKIYAAVLVKYRESKWYTKAENRRLEQQYAIQAQKDERLKELILAYVFKELSQNAKLKEKGDVCEELVLKVDSKYRDSLNRILKHKDFILYDIHEIQENPDVRLAFPKMPILISIKRKMVE